MISAWWSGRSRSQKWTILIVLLIAAVAVVVVGYNLGLTNQSFLVAWFLKLYQYVVEVWGALAFILACCKAYIIREKPALSAGDPKQEEPLEGWLGGAISEGLVVLSQFTIASLLLALLAEGKLGPVTTFDEYGLVALALFLYYSSGKGMGRLIRFIDTHVVGPEQIPALAVERAKRAKQVTVAGGFTGSAQATAGPPAGGEQGKSGLPPQG